MGALRSVNRVGGMTQEIAISQANQVVGYYLNRYPKRQLEAHKATQKVAERLFEGYSVDDLKRAIDGNAASAWHNENGYTSLELIVRDAAHVDRFEHIGAQPLRSVTRRGKELQAILSTPLSVFDSL